jgi:hypothetical protein
MMDIFIEPGDVILFSRDCLAMPFTACLVCCGAKLFSGSSYDHIGIVIQEPLTEALFIMEANMGGVTLIPLKNRIERTSSRVLAVRKLVHVEPDNPTYKSRLWDLSQSYLKFGYNSSFSTNLQSVVHSHAHHTKGSMHWMERIALKNATNSLQAEIKYTNDPFIRMLLDLRIQQIEEQLFAADKSLALEFDSEVIDLQRTNCSQLVADVYLRMGVIEAVRSSLHYIPADFSSDNSTHTIHLMPGYSFTPNLVVIDPKTSAVSELGGRVVVKAAMAPTRFVFGQGDCLGLAACSAVTVTAGRVHVLDRGGRVVNELTASTQRNSTVGSGHVLRAAIKSTTEIQPCTQKTTDAFSAVDPSAYILRETYAAIETSQASAFVNVRPVGHVLYSCSTVD